MLILITTILLAPLMTLLFSVQNNSQAIITHRRVGAISPGLEFHNVIIKMQVNRDCIKVVGNPITSSIDIEFCDAKIVTNGILTKGYHNLPGVKITGEKTTINLEPVIIKGTGLIDESMQDNDDDSVLYECSFAVIPGNDRERNTILDPIIEEIIKRSDRELSKVLCPKINAANIIRHIKSSDQTKPYEFKLWQRKFSSEKIVLPAPKLQIKDISDHIISEITARSKFFKSDRVNLPLIQQLTNNEYTGDLVGLSEIKKGNFLSIAKSTSNPNIKTVTFNLKFTEVKVALMKIKSSFFDRTRYFNVPGGLKFKISLNLMYTNLECQIMLMQLNLSSNSLPSAPPKLGPLIAANWNEIIDDFRRKIEAALRQHFASPSTFLDCENYRHEMPKNLHPPQVLR